MEAPGRARRRVRALLPWIIGCGVLALLASRIEVAALRRAMARGDHVSLAGVAMLVTGGVLFTDSLSTQVGLQVSGLRWPFFRTLVIRGSTYVLALINYTVGQVGLGYALHRAGYSARRVVGVTLFLTGTTFAALILVTTVAWSFDGRGGPLWWMLLGGCGGLLGYLALVRLAPSSLARRELFAPLFEVGVRGYLRAIAGRVPHVLMLVLGAWFGMRAWGLEVPFLVGLTAMPAVVIVTVLPISPGGIGTSQATMVLLFSSFAPEATAAEREASVLAFGMVYFVYGAMAQLVLGLVCRALFGALDHRGAFAGRGASASSAGAAGGAGAPLGDDLP